MAKIKVAINGFGRIGRNVFKIALERDNIEFVGINDLTDTKTLAHLLKYDSTQGKFNGTLDYDDKNIIVNGKAIKISAETNPAKIPWPVTPDLVIEGTGIFTKKEGPRGGYGDHIKNGAKKVLLTAPAKDDIERTIVLGVNDHMLTPDVQFVSNASCTTNCLAPITKVVHDTFGIINALMTTVHSYTNDQRILDFPHRDLRRARSAAVSQIPTTTGAASAIGKVIPELNGKMDGMSIRVPTPTGSLVDLVAYVDKTPSVDAVNEAMKKASEGSMKGILGYNDEPIVSVDIIHDERSSIYDAPSTMVRGHMVKVLSWYDNEWGYSSRVVDLIEKMF